ncbi:hypothetical protein BU26DRAFT_570726 [Trematosphaeria pertusa]|uniref:Uncharacterized protein n=1 Tax=Trematosphaeria pertusa TaxID=390896 RepID=A0A6A6HYG7_9PLEO|nr:uncharacterized protein BU26DRAFT_570726 [Trematosphaeria pertusa]KAF2242663.1 hypothetical protein BU26DRAFT_570726 [Trematosphaeria pertusa]
MTNTNVPGRARLPDTAPRRPPAPAPPPSHGLRAPPASPVAGLRPMNDLRDLEALLEGEVAAPPPLWRRLVGGLSLWLRWILVWLPSH